MKQVTVTVGGWVTSFSYMNLGTLTYHNGGGSVQADAGSLLLASVTESESRYSVFGATKQMSYTMGDTEVLAVALVNDA